VFSYSWRQYHVELQKLAKECDLRWRANALRHSFASYHLAHFQSPEKLALEMGHSSSRMIFEHYREVVTPAAAQHYWAILPL
jgi:integrase